LSSEHNHECIICGKKYKACINCIKLADVVEFEKALEGKFSVDEYCVKNGIDPAEKNKLFFGFRSICDDFACYMAYLTIRRFNKGEIDKYMAQTEIEGLGFTYEDILTWKEDVRDLVLDNIWTIPVPQPVKVVVKRERKHEFYEGNTEE